MGTRTVSLLLAICAAGVWAPAHAQNADTSVVKLPQDIVYGLSHVRHILLRSRRAMGREQAQGLSCRDVIFRTREIAALCVGEGR
jgi:hypothetical protein